jgi:ferric-dicitrate binding protein FerR (iron transport regulator)
MDRKDNIEQCRSEAIAWTLRLKPGVATTDDVAAFKDWCRQDPAHARAFADARGLWDALGPAGQNVFDPGDLESLAGSRASRRVRLGRRAFLTGAAAASVAATAYVAIHPPLDLWPVPLLAGLEAYLQKALSQISGKSKLAQAICYGSRRRQRFDQSINFELQPANRNWTI